MKVHFSEKWNNYLKSFPVEMVDIYYREEYVKLYENERDRALCVVCESENRVTLMPFLRRSVGRFYDFETAYGYGGPIFNTRSENWVNESLEAIANYFCSEGYLCGFIRFHPLIGNASLCEGTIPVQFDRKTVRIDLEPPVEAIWSGQITSKNRNMIRKAEKSGLEYRAECDYASIDDFVELYNSTMQRLNVEEFYYFDKRYYNDFINWIDQNGFLGVISLGEKIVGAALFMMTGKYGHYHLAGSDRNYSSLGINNYLLWNTIKEMKNRGVKCFHLGGGSSSEPDDSLYKFKRSFSSGEGDFCIGKWVFDRDAYNTICTSWAKNNPELISEYGNRLLKYRYTRRCT